MDKQPFPLKWNHPLKEIYSFLSDEDIKAIHKLIQTETEHQTSPIPRAVLDKYCEEYLANKH